MVFTFMPRPLTMAMPASRAMSELGIFSVTLGQRNRMARHTAPTMHACTLTVEMLAATATALSMVSTVGVPTG